MLQAEGVSNQILNKTVERTSRSIGEMSFFIFRDFDTLRQKLVHPKNKTPRHKLDNVVYSVGRINSRKGLTHMSFFLC